MTTPNLEWFLDEVLGVKLTPGQLTLVTTPRGTKDHFADLVKKNREHVPPEQHLVWDYYVDPEASEKGDDDSESNS
jgi:hypothetical protein